MPDMLVKLYDLQEDWGFVAEQQKKGITIRKPIAPEGSYIEEWVDTKFSERWASEFQVGLSNNPTSCFIATANSELVGFACYDTTALGFFGPTGVDESQRGKGTGKALLFACLLDMKLKGYGYAVIGGAGPVDFYKNVVGATEIPGSVPGIFKGMLRRERPDS